MGNLVNGPQHYSQFHPNFVQHDPLLYLQKQGNYFNNGVNHNEQYLEKVGINKTWFYTDQNYLLKFFNIYMNGGLYTWEMICKENVVIFVNETVRGFSPNLAWIISEFVWTD